MNISAIICGRNEATKLINCLESLEFCDEIIYGDLNSSDNSVEIASKYNAKIYEFIKFGPAGEYTQSELIKKVKNDWVLLMDPDEVVDPILAKDIQKTLKEIQFDNEIGDIYVPWQFYFGGIKLRGTVWGFNKFKGIVVNKNRYEILPITHYGKRLKPGFKSYYLENNKDNLLHHFWMDDWNKFIDKHKRYLIDEGQDRYDLGERISFFSLIFNVPFQFYICFIRRKGYLDGWIGFRLSLFWVWYNSSSNLSLFLIQLGKRNE